MENITRNAVVKSDSLILCAGFSGIWSVKPGRDTVDYCHAVRAAVFRRTLNASVGKFSQRKSVGACAASRWVSVKERSQVK